MNRPTNAGYHQREKIPYLPKERVPTESTEQQCLFRWARSQVCVHPELALLHHIPNEGKRSAAGGRRMKAEGLLPGMPDICLPVARGGKHALYIEMKRRTGGRLTEEQQRCQNLLEAQGNAVHTCKGWDEAVEVVLDYLGGAA